MAEGYSVVVDMDLEKLFDRVDLRIPTMPITDSGACRSPIPEHADHLVGAEVHSGAGGSGYGVEVCGSSSSDGAFSGVLRGEASAGFPEG